MDISALEGWLVKKKDRGHRLNFMFDSLQLIYSVISIFFIFLVAFYSGMKLRDGLGFKKSWYESMSVLWTFNFSALRALMWKSSLCATLNLIKTRSQKVGCFSKTSPIFLKSNRFLH